MPTRLYLPSTGSPGLGSLGYGGGWNKTSQAARFAGTRLATRANSSNVARINTSAATSPEFHCCAQFQYPDLVAQTITGTLKGQVRANVNNVSFNGTVAITARIVSSTGSTLRGYLIGTTPAASQSVASPPRMTLTITNRRFRTSTDVTDIPLSTVTAQLDDVLVIEIGSRDVDTGTSRSSNINFQDLTAQTDLPENDTSTGGQNPWVEFSQTIFFVGDRQPSTKFSIIPPI